MYKSKDKTSVKINGFPLYIEYYDSMIIIKDDYENKMKITKKDQIFILLDIEGKFRSCKNNHN